MKTTHRTLCSRTVISGWTALAVAALATTLSCSDPPPPVPPKPEPVVNGMASQDIPASVVYLTPGQVLGMQRRLGAAANLAASVVYGSTDARVADLANQIADDRIALDAQIDAAAALFGVVALDTPTSLQIAGESEGDAGALRALSGSARDDTFVNALVLRESRALGLVDHVLAPNAAGTKWLAAFVDTARSMAMKHFESALVIQRVRYDRRFDTMVPANDNPPSPPLH